MKITDPKYLESMAVQLGVHTGDCTDEEACQRVKRVMRGSSRGTRADFAWEAYQIYPHAKVCVTEGEEIETKLKHRPWWAFWRHDTLEVVKSPCFMVYVTLPAGHELPTDTKLKDALIEAKPAGVIGYIQFMEETLP